MPEACKQPGSTEAPVFHPRPLADSFEWSAEHLPEGALVLASYETGNILPAYAPVRVVVGHGPESVGLTELLPSSGGVLQRRDADGDLHVAERRRDQLRFLGSTGKGIGGTRCTGARLSDRKLQLRRDPHFRGGQSMKRNTQLAPLLICLGPLILFLPGLLQGGSLYWGTPMLQFVPWRELAFDILRSGHIPFWNPYSGMGAPLLANYQTAVFYPPHWLFFFLPIDWGQGLLVAGHLIFTAFGMRKLVRALGGSQLAQIISALAFSLSGYLIARAGFLSINAAAAWLPWIMYAARSA